MYRLHLYLSDDLKTKLEIKAKLTGKSKAEIAREALKEGLNKSKPIKSDSAKALLKLAEMAETLPSDPKDPKDVSMRHDFYSWNEKQIKR